MLLFWGDPSTLQHFCFLLVLIWTIAMIIIFHYADVWTVHSILWTVLCLLCTFPDPHHWRSVQIWVPPGQANSVLLFITVLSHKMSFISIAMLHGSWYLSVAFRSNAGCLRDRPLNLGIICIGLKLLTRLSVSLTNIINALVVSNATCIITYVMLGSVCHFYFLLLRLTWVRLLAFCKHKILILFHCIYK